MTKACFIRSLILIFASHCASTMNPSCTPKSSDLSIVDYDFVKGLPSQPDKLLIDVRRAEEIRETGSIPSSINIPLDVVEANLGAAKSAADFLSEFGRQKPLPTTPLIFSCRSGKRAREAALKALCLGYQDVRVYEGSWLDWEKKSRSNDASA